MTGLALGIIIVVVLIVLATAGGVGYYFYTQRDSSSPSSSGSSGTSGSDTPAESDGGADATKVLANPPSPSSPVILAPEGTTAASLIAQPPVTTAAGNTSSFVKLTPDAVPKTTSGKPAPAPKDTVWVGQKITTSTGKTITVPILAPTKPPKQVVVTKDANGKPLGKPPKGMVWVKKTVRKGSKSVTMIVLEKKV